MDEQQEGKRVIEINGVKMEVDLRTAKRIDTFRVGDRVKVLVKSYGDQFNVFHGVIVAFDDFAALPTISVCYITHGGSLEFRALNAKSEGLEIAACNDDVMIEKGEVIARLNKEIEKRRAEIDDLERKKRYFLDRFGAWFSVPEAVEAQP